MSRHNRTQRRPDAPASPLPSMPRCSPMSRSFLPGHDLRSGGIWQLSRSTDRQDQPNQSVHTFRGTPPDVGRGVVVSGFVFVAVRSLGWWCDAVAVTTVVRMPDNPAALAARVVAVQIGSSWANRLTRGGDQDQQRRLRLGKWVDPRRRCLILSCGVELEAFGRLA